MTDHEENMRIVAERPVPPSDVEEWLMERYGFAVDTASITDAPPRVMEWLTSFRAWLVRFESWRKTRRFDQSDYEGRWRMLGGDWLPARRWLLMDAARKAAESMTDEQFVRWAGSVYEHTRTIDAAERALTALIDGSQS